MALCPGHAPDSMLHLNLVIGIHAMHQDPSLITPFRADRHSRLPGRHLLDRRRGSGSRAKGQA